MSAELGSADNKHVGKLGGWEMWGVGPGMSEKAQICLTDE